MDKFLKIHSLSNLNQDETNMKGPKEAGRLKLVMKNTQTKKKKKKSQEQHSFPWKTIPDIRRINNSFPHSSKNLKREYIQTYFMRPALSWYQKYDTGIRENHKNPTKDSVSYTHLTLPTIVEWCRSRWSPYH